MTNQEYNNLLNRHRRALSGTPIRLVHKQRARTLRKKMRKHGGMEVSRQINLDGLAYYVWMPVTV